ncbi:carbon storage regulator [Alteromonas gracilis]|uniref:carbon storage regulator n=1 Tax=Alteromonas gracilis TaxID=1479524 RepID=UPI00373537A9
MQFNDSKKYGFELSSPSGTTIELKEMDVSIKILKSGTSRVSIGVDAPEHIKINRSKNAKNEL